VGDLNGCTFCDLQVLMVYTDGVCCW